MYVDMEQKGTRSIASASSALDGLKEYKMAFENRIYITEMENVK